MGAFWNKLLQYVSTVVECYIFYVVIENGHFYEYDTTDERQSDKKTHYKKSEYKDLRYKSYDLSKILT